MKKLVLFITMMFFFMGGIFAQTILPAEKYVYDFVGKKADTVIATDTITKELLLNKTAGLFYVSQTKLEAKNTGANAVLSLHAKVFEDDAWTQLKTATWKGTTKDTVITLTEDSSRIYYRHLKLQLIVSNDTVQFRRWQLSLKK